MRLSLRARFAIATAGLVVLVASAVAVAGYVSLDHTLHDQARGAAIDQVAQVAAMVDTRGTGAESAGDSRGGNLVDITDPSLVTQAVRAGLWVAVLRPSGTLIHASPDAPPAFAPAGLLSRCRSSGSAVVTRTSPDALVACRRLLRGRSTVGLVVAGHPLADANGTLRSTRETLLASVLLGGVAAFALAWLVAVRALRPLRAMVSTARSIRHGDRSRRIGHHSSDELGQLAGELDASFAELESVLKRQERFVADASHELKAPLAAAQANVELLRRWAASEPAARAEALAALDRSTVRMGRIVSDLTQLAHGDDRLQYDRVPVRLDDLVLEAQRDARALADGVSVDIGQFDQAVVMGDRDRLRQLLSNVLDNAVSASSTGGAVHVSLERRNGTARIDVTDEGRGLEDDELPHVFDRFFRGRGAGERAGSGLGLSIARMIAREHRGDIQAANEPGAGARFSIELPCDPGR